MIFERTVSITLKSKCDALMLVGPVRRTRLDEEIFFDDLNRLLAVTLSQEQFLVDSYEECPNLSPSL